jgi:hypothetical protein
MCETWVPRFQLAILSGIHTGSGARVDSHLCLRGHRIAVDYHAVGSVRVVAHSCVRQHTSAYVSMRQHTSACVSKRQHTSTCCGRLLHKIQNTKYMLYSYLTAALLLLYLCSSICRVMYVADSCRKHRSLRPDTLGASGLIH